MSLRRRLALLSALAVAFAVLLASVLVYTLVRDRLRGDIDNDLRHQAECRPALRDRAHADRQGRGRIGRSAGPGAGTAFPPGAATAPAG